MRNILIEKVTVNIGVGEPGQKLEQARDLLGRLAGGKKTLETRAKRREPTFRLRKDLPIGCKVTIRGKEAQEFLDKALTAKRKVIKSSNFDKQGNLSFGISEYIDFPGIKYDPSMPMFGFDVCVSLSRPGRRVQLRKLEPAKVGKSHRITKEEAMEFVKTTFGVTLE